MRELKGGQKEFESFFEAFSFKKMKDKSKRGKKSFIDKAANKITKTTKGIIKTVGLNSLYRDVKKTVKNSSKMIKNTKKYSKRIKRNSNKFGKNLLNDKKILKNDAKKILKTTINVSKKGARMLIKKRKRKSRYKKKN